MGNNNEIRQRMEICRNVLLALVWIFGIAEMIGGIVMIKQSYYLRPFGIAAIIVSILGSIIGHFLVNVVLAIPFILLNNGDYLAAIVPEEKQLGINDISVDKQKEGKVEKIYNTNSKYYFSPDFPYVDPGIIFFTKNETVLYHEPTETSNRVTDISKNTKVLVLKRDNPDNIWWSCIRTTNGIEGWLKEIYLEKRK